MEKEKHKKRSGPSSEGNKKKQRKTDSKRILRPRRRFCGKETKAGIDETAMDLVLDSFSQVNLEERYLPSSFKIQDCRECPSTSRDAFSPLARATVIPTLPTKNDGEVILHELTSDAESEFYPEWSSDDVSANDSLDGVAHDTMMGSSSEELEFSDIAFLPIPAAGNEVDEACSSQTASEGRQSPVTKLKPQAVRRVKSMIFEGGKDDEVDPGQRAKAMLRKHTRDLTPSQIAMLPSPLLSAEDAGSLKRSPSQLSAKFSLKRSRSNLTVTENYIKRHQHLFETDIIEEESDDDSMSDVVDMTKKIHPKSKSEL